MRRFVALLAIILCLAGLIWVLFVQRSEEGEGTPSAPAPSDKVSDDVEESTPDPNLAMAPPPEGSGERRVVPSGSEPGSPRPGPLGPATRPESGRDAPPTAPDASNVDQVHGGAPSRELDDRPPDPEEAPGDAVLDGRVVDASFEAISGARVVARSENGATYRRISGAEGRFSFGEIRRGTYQLEATRGVQTGQAGPVVVLGDQTPPVTIVLGADAHIAGVVLDRDGREPVPGIRLRAWEAGAGRSNEGTSDEQGRFRIPVPAPGTYKLSSTGSHSYVDGALTLTVTLAAGERRDDIVYVIERGVRLVGTVTTDAGPVPDATVELVDLRNDQGGNRGQTISDVEGRFSFSGKKPGGRYVARAVHPEHGFGESPPVLTTSHGAQGTLDVRLRPGHAVIGRLHTANGVGIPGIAVWLLKDGGQPWRPIPGSRVQSAGDGTFRMGNVPSGAWQFVVETAPTTRVVSPSFVVEEGRETDRVDIDLGAGVDGFIAGRVTAPEGEPLRGVEMIAHTTAVRLSGVIDTAEDGAYRIDGLGPAATYTVWARGYRLGRFRKSRDDVPVNTAGVDFVLGKMASISGQVLDRDTRAPIQSFHVAGPIIDRDFESPDGRFLIDDIQVSEGIFRFSAEGYLTAVHDPGGIPEGGVIEGLVIELGAPGYIEGTVREAATGAPIQGARIKLILPGVLPVEMIEREFFWDSADPYTDAAGRFILAAHPAGQPNSFVVAYSDHVPVVITDSVERAFEIVMEQAPE